MSDNSNYIVHGVVKACDIDRFLKIQGLGRQPYQNLITNDKYTALVSQLSQRGVQTVFEDEDRVKSLVIAHNELLVHVIRTVDIIPIRLGAVHSTHLAVQNFLQTNAEVFDSIFHRICGRVEYQVEFKGDRATPRSSLLRNESVNLGIDRDRSKQPMGRDYLRMRGESRRLQKNQKNEFDRFAEESLNKLGKFSQEIVQSTASNVFSVLTDRGPSQSFLSAVEQLAQAGTQAGIELTVSGPWPAYSFTSLDGVQ
ncbi:MAG: GvpL/GvpF family gas vesicle protein [Pseudomonadota bacterium]